MTTMQHRLANLIQEIAKEGGTDEQGALRDIMTDFRHIAELYSLDIEQAVEGSKAVYAEEIETGCNARTNM